MIKVKVNEVKTGDVISLPFMKNQENNEGTKRWCVVTEKLEDEIEVVPLTKKTHQQKRYTKKILIKKKSKKGKQMGLTYNSLLMIDRTERIKLKYFNHFNKNGVCNKEMLEKLQKMLAL